MPTAPAKGCPKGDLLKTVILLDPETHEQVRQMAIRDQTSFASAARMLIEWGLEAEMGG